MSNATSSTRRAVASRVLAAVIGGYAVAYLATAFLTVHLPLARADRVTFASLGCFAVYTAAILYAFGVRSAWRAWLVLASLTLLLALAAYLPGDYGVRP